MINFRLTAGLHRLLERGQTVGAGSVEGTPGSPQDEPRPRGHGTEWKPLVGSGQARLGLRSHPKASAGVNAVPALCI